ncbi:HAMP domain-containing protein [Streptomyces sioyaensis]|uniref:HAMP domain-containing protein n=1 Tax=Streptomyces sioyaensis TaxID=67364 RepID=UPI0037BB8DD6
MGLRIKIGLTIATTAAVASVATGSLMPQLIQDDRRDRVRDQLGAAVKQYERTGSGVEVDPPGLPPKAREAASNGLTTTYLQEDEADTWVWAATRDKDGKTLAIRRHFPKALLKEVSAVTLRAAVYGALAALGVGVALAAAMSRRLRRSARQAGQIAAGDLSARLPQRGRDEIAHLARAVNNMADALASRIQAEQEVTANIAHELRTPVAGMVAAAGLLPEGRPAEMVQERAGRLRDLMEDVLEVARLDNGGEQAERQEVELGALARRVVAGVLADRTAEVTVCVIRDARRRAACA